MSSSKSEHNCNVQHILGLCMAGSSSRLECSLFANSEPQQSDVGGPSELPAVNISEIAQLARS